MKSFYASQSTTELIVFIFVLLFAVWYLSTQAGRLDRLHHRVHVASSALDTQLARRAGIIVELALSLDIDPVSQAILAQAGHDALTSTHTDWTDRADIENQLTDNASDILNDLAELVTTGEYQLPQATRDQLIELSEAWQSMQMSRRFHADAVRACLVIRQQKLVRWLHLAGHARLPETHDFNDELPVGLATLTSA